MALGLTQWQTILPVYKMPADKCSFLTYLLFQPHIFKNKELQRSHKISTAGKP